MEWKIAAVITICLFAIASFVQAQEADESDKKLKGEVRFRYDFFEVGGDRGRFREDHWLTDQSTGGLDWLHIESTEPDKRGYEWILDARALYDYDYRMSLLMKKQDSHYLKLDFSGFRRYYDGSNEFWSPSGVNLAELSDSDFFVDRRNYNIELGLTPPEGRQWVFGWHRLEKDGKEVLLFGGDAHDDNFHGIPVISNTRGITDTIYGEVSQTFADKYNFRIRQEFEQYHAEQSGDWSTRVSDGSVRPPGAATYSERFADDLGYTNWRTMFMFDSFLNEETYVTANYMYNYLNNDSTHNSLGRHFFNTTSGGNSRRTNVGAFGYRRANFMRVPALDFTASVRLEDSKTTSGLSGMADHYSFPVGYDGIYTPESHSSRLDEVRVGEAVRLVYKGIKKTTLSFDADLEQRDLDWSSHINDDGDISDHETDIDFQDQIYTFKAVHRFNRAVKSTVKFRIKDLERSYTTLFDSTPDGYPGWLGSYRRTGEDLTVKTDFRLNNKASTTLMYQVIQESINFALGGKTQNLEIHRGAGSLSFSPTQNLFLVGTFMLENYRLDTPANGITGNMAPGTRPYDFRGNSYSILLDGTYAFNEKTSATLGFRHTEALGTVDYAGDYVYDTVSLMLKHKFENNQTMGVGYRFINFNNHDGGKFDDYRTHGVFVTYGFTF
jgi:hypothetical protein